MLKTMLKEGWKLRTLLRNDDEDAQSGDEVPENENRDDDEDHNLKGDYV